jgi:hypothetical protein
MAVFFAAEVVNVSLFIAQETNSEEMILLDSVFLSIVAVTTTTFLTILSSRIRVVLMTIGAINASSTQPQVRRIKWMTHVANTFFLVRVALECAFAISCIITMRCKLISIYVYGTLKSTFLPILRGVIVE